MTQPASEDHADLIKRIIGILESIPARASKDRDQIRKEILQISESFKSLRKLAKLRLVHVTDEKAALNRLVAYLKLFVGRVISGDELAVVAATRDPGRRIRQIRVEWGYRISTGLSRDDLKPSEYVLESAEPDAEEAKKWKTANEIKRSSMSAQNKWLALLKAYLGLPVTQEQMRYVAPDKDRRRIRELRTEHGWRVATKFTGRPDLPSGQYVLESEQQLPEHDRKIDDTVFDQVLRRDNLKCRRCDWSVDLRHPSEKRQFLEVHHVMFHQFGGDQDIDNLVTLCNVDHDEVHRKKIMGDDLRAWIKKGPKAS
jgi:hypothetical protein